MAFSQSGQDAFIDGEVFHGMTNGFFVDIGAHNGVTFSNSLLFERDRGWRGICVEPMPHRFAELRASRKCACVQGCVAPSSGRQSFTMVVGQADMLSGLTEGRFQEKHPAAGDAEGGLRPAREIEVDCFAFNELMEHHQVQKIDYCSIDTEGSELSILQSIDFSRYGASCYSIEENGHYLGISRRLKKEGYRIVQKLGPDLIFVRKNVAAQMNRVGFLQPWALQRRIARAVWRRVAPSSRD